MRPPYLELPTLLLTPATSPFLPTPASLLAAPCISSIERVHKSCQAAVGECTLLDSMLRLSKYYHELQQADKERYRQKVACVQVDPYLIPKGQWEDDAETFPAVTYPDIVTYFLLTKSKYTADDLKAYKSLEAYNQFVSGWVRDVGAVKPPNGSLRIISARVMHSQRIRDTSLRPWAIAEATGNIVSAHCDCMAGLGETCTHVAAMLFAVDAKLRATETATVTGKQPYWKAPSKKNNIDYLPGHKIDFRSARKRKADLDKALPAPIQHQTPGGSTSQKIRALAQPKARINSDLHKFYRQLSNSDSKPAILSLVRPFSAKYIPQSLNRDLPEPLTLLYDATAEKLDQSALVKHCEGIANSLSITEEAVEAVQQATTSQWKSQVWFNMRAGRITASRLKAACHTNPDNPSVSLVKAICYPKEMSFSTSATRWGCSHEKAALLQYEERCSKIHDSFKLTDAGLVLHPSWPYLGASPDSFVSCNCCGEGCVEVKCPYCPKDISVHTAATTIPSFCTKVTGSGQLSLLRTHKYFYQVQAQMHLSNRQYCDFVIWTKTDMHIERLEPDASFWELATEKARGVFTRGILPELVARFHSKPQGSSTSPRQLVPQCCQTKKKKGQTTVLCSNPLCHSKIFHLSCMKLKKKPSDKWLCTDCRKRFREKKKY